jgi:hypothetical protein
MCSGVFGIVRLSIVDKERKTSITRDCECCSKSSGCHMYCLPSSLPLVLIAQTSSFTWFRLSQLSSDRSITETRKHVLQLIARQTRLEYTRDNGVRLGVAMSNSCGHSGTGSTFRYTFGSAFGSFGSLGWLYIDVG